MRSARCVCIVPLPAVTRVKSAGQPRSGYWSTSGEGSRTPHAHGALRMPHSARSYLGNGLSTWTGAGRPSRLSTTPARSTS